MQDTGSGATRPRVRVVVAASGDDANARVVARALRDAGHEVIWSGADQPPEHVVATAIQEDADAVGLCPGDASGDGEGGGASVVLGTIVALLAGQDAADIVVFCSGAGAAAPRPPGGVRLFAPGEQAEIARWVAARAAG